uniref:collagen alpha-1(I) chain-like n=1 Tax=Callithrix jacchus TaxID=9483 RepID=UPI0023DD507B|nr:collagen alpha-1(I) chain-like [Callithrix jacchus]
MGEVFSNPLNEKHLQLVTSTMQMRQPRAQARARESPVAPRAYWPTRAAPHQLALVGRGPSYACFRYGPGGYPRLGQESARTSESGRWGRPRELPSPPRQVLSALPAQPEPTGFHGNRSGVRAPRSSPHLPAQLPMTETGRNTGGGTDHRLGSPASAARSPQRAQEGPPGDPHRHRPDCAGHCDWFALSRRGSIPWCWTEEGNPFPAPKASPRRDAKAGSKGREGRRGPESGNPST